MQIDSYSYIDLGGRILHHASEEERLALTRIFSPQAQFPLRNTPLADAICRNGGNGIANFLRGRGVSYTELLHDTAKIVKLEAALPISSITSHGVTISEMDSRCFNPSLDGINFILWRDHLDKFILATEKSILSKIAVEIYHRMTVEQKKVVDQKILEMAKTIPGESLNGIGTAGALMILGNLGGFATYTLMSTIISSITLGTVGIGVYTFASSALSVLLGPIGLLGIGVAALYKFTGPDDRKSLQAIATIAMIRQRLISENILKY